ncbi:MAG: hypothetical protein MMC33_008803 [Icmadophila ericetorum]|nr:hypothetical protein [Icmadophila ericetorum]
MASKTVILPDTAIAAIANDEVIHTYVQHYYADLVESTSRDGKRFTSRLIPYTSWGKVKLFTPLAAAFLDNGATRYLFYLDNKNVINDMVCQKGGAWKKGDLGDLHIVTAHYSKLAAVTLPSSPETIYVYYQTPDIAGDIREVHGRDSDWKPDTHDFGDPPLFGTSLAAVLPEAGLTIHSPSGDKIPVVFFQEDNLKLAELQNQAIVDFLELKSTTPAASPHTPLAAVDDGQDAYLFYTSDENTIRRIKIDQNGQLIGPLRVEETTPKGNLAAVIWKGSLYGSETEEVIVFYQPQYNNIVTQTVSDRKTLSTVRFTFSGSGKSRTLSGPVVEGWELNFE